MSKNKTNNDSENNENLPGNETRTDYTKAEGAAHGTPGATYEEPIEATKATSDTSTKALTEKREIEEAPSTKKTSGETGE